MPPDPNTDAPPGTGAENVRLRAGAEDAANSLVRLGTREWQGLNDEERRIFLSEIDVSYRRILDEFFIVANKCVEQHQRFFQLHGTWRRRVIVTTGIVTIVNVLAASKIPWTSAWLSIVAAVCAAGLGILEIGRASCRERV